MQFTRRLGQQSNFGQVLHGLVDEARAKFGNSWPAHIAFLDYGCLQRTQLLELQGHPKLVVVILPTS
jgi:hypothetical protein